MNKKEIMNYVEDQIAYHCDEFGLVREEVEEVVLLNCVEYYYHDDLSLEDLIKCAEYLDYPLNVELIKIEKELSQSVLS